MAPKNKASKLPVDRAEASKAAAFATAWTVVQDGTAMVEPPAPQAMGDSMVPPSVKRRLPKGWFRKSNSIKMEMKYRKRT